MKFATTLATGLLMGLLCGAAEAEQPTDFLNQFANEAGGSEPAPNASGQGADAIGFSAERGKAFFNTTHGNDWSCASCHTQNPLAQGQHAVTNKVIQPISPNANSERFTNPAKVEKWFKRNCNDVLKRACTAQEKGDVLTYLLSVKN